MATPSTRKLRSDGERSRRTILREAARLATIDGLEGLSIGSLASSIGMSKSGLYAHFGSKEELQLATVETALEVFSGDVLAPTEAARDALEKVRVLCDAFLAHVERRAFPGGCFFASAMAEFAALRGPVRDRIAAIQHDFAAYIASLIAEAQRNGSLHATEDPAQLAFDLEAAMLLGNNGFVLHDDPAYLQHARAAIERRLEQAGAPPRSGR
ncbi:MAG: TetR/AcrR family transcriptional regulator [Thermoleophilia bacterium]